MERDKPNSRKNRRLANEEPSVKELQAQLDGLQEEAAKKAKKILEQLQIKPPPRQVTADAK